MDKSKLGSILGTVGLAGGILYGMRNHKGFLSTALYSSVFAVAGVLVGNQISKLSSE